MKQTSEETRTKVKRSRTGRNRGRKDARVGRGGRRENPQSKKAETNSKTAGDDGAAGS